ncbi:hypothetical protein [Helicobacter sp. MIT 14-3879]|uniref:hypothetical protein n=1 Tax=Helicobacter sp. MIT 14-3879 TaxID=2040649 RepID=UPI0015F14CA9|nr:hypothetical protein [Helicobacter sp. MIT 14-3879]
MSEKLNEANGAVRFLISISFLNSIFGKMLFYVSALASPNKILIPFQILAND